jgi:UrcA family protein
MNRLITVAVAFASAAALAGVAAAQTTVAPVVVSPGDSIVVSYADLDLSGSAGMSVLKGRVSRAADRLCGQRSRILDVELQRRDCRAFALAGAAPQIAAARGAALASGPRQIVLARR